MIPLRLRLQNFLCFGEDVPTLDLDGVRLACLCGQNGHGKSALLDAMTWALWGSARGSDRNRSQDELIYYGREEMLVELDFLAPGHILPGHPSPCSRRRQTAHWDRGPSAPGVRRERVQALYRQHGPRDPGHDKPGDRH